MMLRAHFSRSALRFFVYVVLLACAMFFALEWNYNMDLKMRLGQLKMFSNEEALRNYHRDTLSSTWFSNLQEIKRTRLQPGIQKFFSSLLEKYEKYKRSRASFVIGIPTVNRIHVSYLQESLESLFKNTTEEEQTQMLIIVCFTDNNMTYIQGMVKDLEIRFQKQLMSGLLELTALSSDVYPDFSHLPTNFGDSEKRVKWRTKESLDCGFLMMYAKDRCDYYIHMEDDVNSTRHFITEINRFIESKNNPSSWMILDLSWTGSAGLLFRSSEIEQVSDFILTFASYKPIDWILNDYVRAKTCPVGAESSCGVIMRKAFPRFHSQLLKHSGKYSSMKGIMRRVYH